MRRIAVLLFFLVGVLSSADADTPAAFPVYVMQVPNPNDYTLFANGGWDGNWYVGYNTCWIKRLPPVPAGDYTRAFIGARLGRMKLLTNSRNVWDKQPVPGSIYMAIASTSAWRREDSFEITTTREIPLEGDYAAAVEGIGESQWFWKEIPLALVNLKGENYLALWSPTPELISVSSSPVLAAAWGGKAQDTWLTRDINGVAPNDPLKSLGAPISYFQPAIALKLLPRGPAHALSVRVIGWKGGSADHPKPVVTVGAEGDSVERVWLEYAARSGWTAVGRALWKAPYIFSVDSAQLPSGRVQLRAVASNIWEERSASAPFTVEVGKSSKN